MQAYNGNLIRYVRRPWLIYAIAALLVCLPWFRPGFILTLDMVFTPLVTIPASSDPHFIYLSLLKLLSLVVPVEIIQKVLLFAIFVLAGYSAHVFISFLLQKIRGIKQETVIWPAYFTGLLYIYNPFVYSRLMAGQYMLLIGYAVLPLFLYAMWRFCGKPVPKNMLQVAATLAAICFASLHMAAIAAILAFLISAVFLWQKRSEAGFIKRIITQGSIGLAILVILNSLWLVPLFLKQGALDSTLGGFTISDQLAFETSSGEWGTVANLLMLQGFWGDDRNLYLIPSDVFSWWIIGIICVWIIVGIGIIQAFILQRKIAIFFVALLGAGIISASGLLPFSSISPLGAGFREPQKFAVLIVLGYVYFGAYSVLYIQARISRLRVRQAVGLMLCLLPLAIAPLLPLGGGGQLQSKPYPKDWYAVRTRLAEEKGVNKVLFLPWHFYMPLSFTSGTTANPAPKFFGARVIASTDPEFGGANSYKKLALQDQITTLLASGNADPILAERLKNLGITHIILAKEFDYAAFGYISAKSGIKKEISTATIEVYRIISR